MDEASTILKEESVFKEVDTSQLLQGPGSVSQVRDVFQVYSHLTLWFFNECAIKRILFQCSYMMERQAHYGIHNRFHFIYCRSASLLVHGAATHKNALWLRFSSFKYFWAKGCLLNRCLVLSCLVLSCLVLSCLVLSCLVLSCLVLSCLVRQWKLSSRMLSTGEHQALESMLLVLIGKLPGS